MSTDLKAPLPIANGDVETGCMRDCAICLEVKDNPDEVCQLSCTHTFHKQCINQSFRAQYIADLDITCPLCRLVLQDKSSTDYILKRISVMQTLPSSHIGPPIRLMLPNHTGNMCFERTLICAPLVFIVLFFVGAYIWTHA